MRIFMQGGEMMVPFKTHSKTLPSTTYNLKTKQNKNNNKPWEKESVTLSTVNHLGLGVAF